MEIYNDTKLLNKTWTTLSDSAICYAIKKTLMYSDEYLIFTIEYMTIVCTSLTSYISVLFPLQLIFQSAIFQNIFGCIYEIVLNIFFKTNKELLRSSNFLHFFYHSNGDVLINITFDRQFTAAKTTDSGKYTISNLASEPSSLSWQYHLIYTHQPINT